MEYAFGVGKAYFGLKKRKNAPSVWEGVFLPEGVQSTLPMQENIFSAKRLHQEETGPGPLTSRARLAVSFSSPVSFFFFLPSNRAEDRAGPACRRG